MPDFLIIRKIGQGGMGVVHEAWQVSRLKRTVALKVRQLQLSPEGAGAVSPRARDPGPAAPHTHRAHPHRRPARPVQYFAMAYIDGAALHNVIQANGARDGFVARPNPDAGRDGASPCQEDQGNCPDDFRVQRCDGPASRLPRSSEPVRCGPSAGSRQPHEVLPGVFPLGNPLHGRRR